MKYGSKEVMTEFLRSDLKIVVAGMNLWQAGRLKAFLKNEKLAVIALALCHTGL